MHVDEEDKTTALIQGSGSNYKSNAVLVNETGFTEGEDYCSFLSDRVDGFPGKPGQGAALTLDMAKEICMLQQNEKSKQARQYFIQLEKNTVVLADGNRGNPQKRR